MQPHEAVGYLMLNEASVTTLTSTRIYHGLRPKGTAAPCINFFELGGGDRFQGMERQSFSINCRAKSATVARQLASLVTDLFEGTQGEGIYGDVNASFEVSRSYLRADNGLIPETEDRIFNAPVDITILYPRGTVT